MSHDSASVIWHCIYLIFRFIPKYGFSARLDKLAAEMNELERQAQQLRAAEEAAGMVAVALLESPLCSYFRK